MKKYKKERNIKMKKTSLGYVSRSEKDVRIHEEGGGLVGYYNLYRISGLRV